jgi:hypothetical protein
MRRRRPWGTVLLFLRVEQGKLLKRQSLSELNPTVLMQSSYVSLTFPTAPLPSKLLSTLPMT